MVTSLSCGWLDITRSSIRYQVAQPESKAADSFAASRQEIIGLNFQGLYLEFQSQSKKQTIFYLPQSEWGTVHGGPGVFRAAERDAGVTGAIFRTMQNFDETLAQVKPPAPAPPPIVLPPVAPPPAEPKPAAPPPPPAIVLTSPPGAVPDQVVEMSQSPLVLRGVAMDASGIPVVTINGSSANMRPKDAQAAEFWSDPLPLQPGANRIQITASNPAHAEAQLVFTVHYTPAAAPVNPRRLDKQQILALLQGGVPSARIAGIIKERGLKFAPSAENLDEIRGAGGSDELIQTIQQAAAPK